MERKIPAWLVRLALSVFACTSVLVEESRRQWYHLCTAARRNRWGIALTSGMVDVGVSGILLFLAINSGSEFAISIAMADCLASLGKLIHSLL